MMSMTDYTILTLYNNHIVVHKDAIMVTLMMLGAILVSYLMLSLLTMVATPFVGVP